MVQTPPLSPFVLVLSTSLNPDSRSAMLAKEAYALLLKNKNISVDWIDLREFSVPVHNGHDQSAYTYDRLKEIHDRILQAQGILLAAPIYNYSIGASCKNIIELTGHPYKTNISGTAWIHKVVSFLGACGTPRSFMAPMPILNSLFLDFKVVLTPSYVLASLEDFDGSTLSSSMLNRLQNLTDNFISLTSAVQKISWKE